MAFQTSYDIDQAVGFEGMKADMRDDTIITGLAEGEIFIGKAVTIGTLDRQVKHPTLATDITDVKKVKGAAIHSHSIEQKYPVGTGNYSYPDKSAVSVAQKCVVWVKPETLVTARTSDVHVYYAGAKQKGSFGGTAVGGETAIMPNAKWLTTTTVVGELAQLQIDL